MNWSVSDSWSRCRPSIGVACAYAGATHAATSLLLIRVARRVLMTLRAVRFGEIPCQWAVTAQHVLPGGSWSNVIRVDAVRSDTPFFGVQVMI